MFPGVAFYEVSPFLVFPSFLFSFFPFILGVVSDFLVFCYTTFVLSALVLIGKSFFFFLCSGGEEILGVLFAP